LFGIEYGASCFTLIKTFRMRNKLILVVALVVLTVIPAQSQTPSPVPEREAAALDCCRLGNAALRNGQAAEALIYASKGLEWSPADPRSWLLKVDALCKLNRPKEALAALEEKPRSTLYSSKKIEILTLLGRYDEALQLCDQLDAYKSEPDPLYYGHAHPEGAEKAGQAAQLELACIRRAKVLEARGNHSAAVDQANRAYTADIESFRDTSKIGQFICSLHGSLPAVPIPAPKYDSDLDALLSDEGSQFVSLRWKLEKHRNNMLADLVSSYPLITMKSEQVQELLGEPAHYPYRSSWTKTDIYTLELPKTPSQDYQDGHRFGHGTCWLEINYSIDTVQTIAIRHGHVNIAGSGTTSRSVTASGVFPFGPIPFGPPLVGSSKNNQ
jgi:hypothetical protein